MRIEGLANHPVKSVLLRWERQVEREREKA